MNVFPFSWIWGISDMRTFSLSVIDSCFQGEVSFLIAIKLSPVETVSLFVLHTFLGEGCDFILVSKGLWVHVEYQCCAV